MVQRTNNLEEFKQYIIGKRTASFTQKEFSERIGFSKSLISKMENLPMREWKFLFLDHYLKGINCKFTLQVRNNGR